MTQKTVICTMLLAYLLYWTLFFQRNCTMLFT